MNVVMKDEDNCGNHNEHLIYYTYMLQQLLEAGAHLGFVLPKPKRRFYH